MNSALRIITGMALGGFIGVGVMMIIPNKEWTGLALLSLGVIFLAVGIKLLLREQGKEKK